VDIHFEFELEFKFQKRKKGSGLKIQLQLRNEGGALDSVYIKNSIYINLAMFVLISG